MCLFLTNPLSGYNLLAMAEDTRTAAIYKAIGRVVAQLRTSPERNLTQVQLSQLTQGRLSRSAIANIESGRQRVAVHHLYDLAAAMNCSPNDFLRPEGQIFGSPESLAAQVDDDPEAKAFTLRILGSQVKGKEK